jgi:hypothetical protein
MPGPVLVSHKDRGDRRADDGGMPFDTDPPDTYFQTFVIGVAVAALPRYGSLYICSIVRSTL